MIDRDITDNITADCQKRMQTQEAHDIDCTCDSCCRISGPNCQDNRDQCEETEQSSGRMTKMKHKFMPIMGNCAVILAVIGLSGSINRINALDRIAAINIAPIHGQDIPGFRSIDTSKIINLNRSSLITSNHIESDIEVPRIVPGIAEAIAD